MSDLNLDDELVQEYLAECREHLATIENDLLTIEQAGAEIDEQVVNRVFRAAHSIKGGAGFFDLNTIRELAHKTENVLDMVRSRQLVPTPEVVSILLLAFDKLRELLDAHHQSNDADIAEFVSALERLTADNLPAEERHSVTERVVITIPEENLRFEVSGFDLAQVRKGGQCIYLIRYDLIHDVQRAGRAPYEVLKPFLASGTILETLLDFGSAGTLDEEPSNQLPLDILYATALDPASLLEMLVLPPSWIHAVEDNGAVKQMDAVLADAELLDAEPLDAAPVDAASVDTTGLPAPPPPPVTAAPPPAAENPKTPPAAAPPSHTESTIRLNVTLLDSLMTLAGELVLSRNQLNESLAREDRRGITSGAQRVSLVTSELQEVVTLTRMQPVGTVFAKFPRLVRDLARDLGKEAQLQIEGGEVELDKTILEGLSDPLTHMVRNSVDHGVESPTVRAAAGKPQMGTIKLKASHQAGQVVIEISDDGKGLDQNKVAAAALTRGAITREQLQAMTEREKMALIFLPGVSTAEKVSDVSGRGVGMDVVKTNLDKLGGKIEIDSTPGLGSSFRIKLPLTLAIIPSLLISDSGERFAIPQVSVGELIRIPPAQVAQRIDRVGDAEILILRDRLVPLLRLSDTFGLPRSNGEARAINVVLVDTGAFEYGLVVEQLHDTVEIVVKPLGRHVKGLQDYAGATILGDGRVAVILDVAGLAARAGLSAAAAQALARQETKAAEVNADGELFSLLLFHNGPEEWCAVPIDLVARVERVRPAQIEYLGGRRTMQYCNASLPVVTLSDVASVGQVAEGQPWVVIVFERAGKAFGLLAAEPLDMVESHLLLDRLTLRQRGVAGSAIIKGHTTLMVDILELVESALPEWSETSQMQEPARAPSGAVPTVLLAEDSDFFRGQLKRLIEAVGYPVLAAEDGEAAWELLDQHAGEIGLVTTDIEMPRLDGLGLTRRIRADARFENLPVIAVSTLAGEDEIARGLAAGVNEYQIKLNKEELLKSIQRTVGGISMVPVAAQES